jgi:hypothetical protein
MYIKKQDTRNNSPASPAGRQARSAEGGIKVPRKITKRARPSLRFVSNPPGSHTNLRNGGRYQL